MMATGGFAIPTLRWLAQSQHQLLAVVTRPAAPSPRDRRRQPPHPVRDAARERNVPLLEPHSINDVDSMRAIAALGADAWVVCDYGQILSPQCLAVPPKGAINLHGSLLPAYRGAAPVQWALLDGQTETGITVIHMSPRLDAGPILVQRSTPIGDDEDAVQLEHRLAELGPPAVATALEMLQAWNGRDPLGTPQDRRRVSRAPRLTKQDGRVVWTNSAERIRNQIRALKPWPGTHTELFLGDSPDTAIHLILHQAEIASDAFPDAPPGHIHEARDRMVVQTGQGVLAITRLQPAGKRVMDVEEFLRGHLPPAASRMA
jgi:methionyl-tRNA formyltransferase